jgi:DNA helicase HerA-like ATPase
MSKIIGRCIGETSPTRVSFISKEMPRVGEYVSLAYDEKTVLGMIESLARGSVSINDEIYDPATVEKIKEIEGDDHYIRGTVTILGDINTPEMTIPRTPAPPGTVVKIANSKILENVFKIDAEGLELGNLITEDNVRVAVDINKMITRHLAILAMTGAGKSNTVAVLTDGLLKVNGSILFFDMHSEYVNARFENGEVNLIEAKVNPQYLSFYELARLANISSKAYIQERIFRNVHTETMREIRKNNISARDFFDHIKKRLEEILSSDDDNRYKDDKKSITAVLNKVINLERQYGNILDFNAADIVEKIETNSANIIDLGSVDEYASDILVSHVLEKVLKKRKDFLRSQNGLEFPVFIVLEEAHILAPKNRSTRSKSWISRIAREGRKFGVGLCIVSQSPKSLDPDALSQANNMIILRLVEPNDQRHVQSASESLSDDLVAQLPSLNIGEAIILGLMTKIPTLVKIDRFKGKIVGTDLDIVGEWRRAHDNEKSEIEEKEDELRDLMG